jgi:hypothetical protein
MRERLVTIRRAEIEIMACDPDFIALSNADSKSTAPLTSKDRTSTPYVLATACVPVFGIDVIRIPKDCDA